jgi:hypothetical protein
MKILRKDDEFKKMPEGNVQELLLIKRLVSEGWNYCSRQTYKEFHKPEKSNKESKSENSHKSKKKSKEL